MPGYLYPPSSAAVGTSFVPSGNISSSNVQAAIEELDTEKTTSSYVDGEITTVNSSISSVDTKATSAKTLALLGL
jgi:hypothetical protein